MEVEAVDEGTVAKIVVPAGTEGVKVNAVIAVLAEEGEDAGAAAAAAGKPAQGEKAEKPKQAERPAAPAAPVQTAALAAKAEDRPASERVFASPLARRIAKEAGIDVAQLGGSGPHGRVVRADVEAAIAGGTGKAAAAPSAAPA